MPNTVPGGWTGLKKRVRTNMAKATYDYARAVVGEAQMRVPVRTGYLRSQIKWRKNDLSDYTIFVEGDPQTRTGAFYGVYVEYGTRHMAAQPYFRPAVEHQKSLFKEQMRAVFRE